MKTNRFKLIFTAWVIGLFFLCIPMICFAHGQGSHTHTENENGIESALIWVRLVDEKKYNASWQTAATVFQSKIDKGQWADAAALVREPLGKLISRDIFNDQLLTSLPGMPDGFYLLIRFVSKFANKAHAVETITMVKEADGIWKAAGYFIK